MWPVGPIGPPVAWSVAMSSFVDESQLNVRGGDGGAGCVSFRREGPVTMGGPNGGDGGKGGDVWLVADRNVASLLAFRDHPHRRASNGVHGKGKDQHGKSGRDEVVAVPEGTVVHDLYSGEVLADLVHHGDRWLAAEGGRGGRGNARFLSNRRRAPSFAEQGEQGFERWLKLDLKLMADVAIVGFPNAGKSTLISRISAAKPKIADYPFTTLAPHLGVVRLDDGFEMVVADIPGLIEGASAGKGLGHQFLRHVERARALCVLVDLAATDGTTPQEQERVLLQELGAYRPDLLDRPRIVVASKADVAQHDWDGMRLSAVTGEGLNPLLTGLRRIVEEARQAEPDSEGFVIHRIEPDGVRVERTAEHEFTVHGRAAERAVALSDLTNPDALAYADRRLKRLGVDKALARAGALPGDVVHVGTLSFEYEPDA
jgi:GTPase